MTHQEAATRARGIVGDRGDVQAMRDSIFVQPNGPSKTTPILRDLQKDFPQAILQPSRGHIFIALPKN